MATRKSSKQHLFLSHDHRDQAIAHALATSLNRITLGQLEVWFSSDLSPEGGIQPGQVWLDEIRSHLKQSKAILALLTPRSVSRPWLLFESGFGAGLVHCEIIPVCIGVNPGRDVPFPLGMYQCFQLADYESLKRFCSKLLRAYRIAFDEEMAAPILTRVVSELVKLSSFEEPNVVVHRDLSMQELAETIKQHFDRRIVELVGTEEGKKGGRRADSDRVPPSYSVPVVIRFPQLHQPLYLEIDKNTTLQDVLDNIYFILEAEVPAFSYLTAWILREVRTGMQLVIREVTEMIPAMVLFTPNTLWEAVPLKQPYSPDDSKDIDRWYRTKL